MWRHPISTVKDRHVAHTRSTTRCGRSTACWPPLTGVYVLVFGVVGAVRTTGSPLFDRSDIVVLGLRTNLAFALLSVVVRAS